MPEVNSTFKAWPINNLITYLDKPGTDAKVPGMIIMNLSTPSGLITEGKHNESIHKLAKQAAELDIPMMIISDCTITSIGEDWETQELEANKVIQWESPYAHITIPILEKDNNIYCHWSEWGWKEENYKRMIMSLVAQQGQDSINNM